MEFFKDLLERAAATFVQTLVVVLFAAGSDLLHNPDWLVAVVAGGIAAAVSVLTTLAGLPLPKLPPYPDLLLRVVKTFLQAFVGALVVSNYIDVNWAGALATALPVALLALVKGLVAMATPGTVGGASLLAAPRSADGKATVITSARTGATVTMDPDKGVSVTASKTGTTTPTRPQPGQSFADPGTPLH